MSTAASVFRQLHRIHQQLSELRERQARGPRQVKAHQANVAKMDQDLTAARDQFKQARIAVDQQQLQLKSLEYQALRDQIAADEMAKSVLEDEILEALGKIDELQVAGGECEHRLSRAKEELAKVEVTVREQLVIIQGEMARLDGELKATESHLPAEFRDVYARVVKSKGSDGMAQVENDCCGGCFQQIQPNRINQLVLENAVLCTSCGRLLYLPEDRRPGQRRRDS